MKKYLGSVPLLMARWDPSFAMLVSIPATLLAAQVVLFIWLAPRGLDFTDESYYLLSYLHWRDFAATATFFAAYLELPFRLLGRDVAAIRIAGIAVLIGAGGLLAWRAMKFIGGVTPKESQSLPFVVTGMMASLFYFSYTYTLRAPSYNSMVLVCMLVATSMLLVLTAGTGSRSELGWAAFAYGAAFGACALCKAPSAAVMLLFHVMFFVSYAQHQRTFEWLSFGLAGVVLNIAWLYSLQPNWIHILAEGVKLTVAMDGRYASFPLDTLVTSVLRGAARIGLSLLLVTLILGFVLRHWPQNRTIRSCLTIGIVGGVVLAIQLQGYGKSWWVLFIFGAGVLWWILKVGGDDQLAFSHQKSALGLTLLLFGLPIAFSIGTNGSLPGHTQMAAIFGVIALLLPLSRLWDLRLIHSGTLAISLGILCLPPLVSQMRSMNDPSITYRLRTGLLDQDTPQNLGASHNRIFVDALTHGNVDRINRAMNAAGYVVGQPIIDMTGDGPGLVYVLGGLPLGSAWLVGGYVGSDGVAANVLRNVPVELLSRAWILSSEDNPRRIKKWHAVLTERIGESSHKLVDVVPYSAQFQVQEVHLELWKPVGFRQEKGR